MNQVFIETATYVTEFIRVMKDKDMNPEILFDSIHYLMSPEYRTETQEVVEKKKRDEEITEEEAEESLYRSFDEYFDHVNRSHPKREFLDILGRIEILCASIDNGPDITIKSQDFLALLHLMLKDMNEDYKKQFPGEPVIKAWPNLDIRSNEGDPWAEVRAEKASKK